MKNITLKSAVAVAVVLCACAGAWALPKMTITTQNNQDPTVSGGGIFGGAQTMNYVKITSFKLEDAGSHNLTLTPEPTGEADSIRVRGNSTAGADKKPYRIKFDKEQGLFGQPKANSWVLLANYYDHTFALNAIAFRLGQKLGLEFTNSSQFVNLYLNGQYKGIYQLTEQIQVKKSRVNVDKDYGFLVEFDYHDKANDEVKFTAAQYSLGTFIKSPEIPGCDAKPVSNCNDNNTAVKWVKDTLNALMNKMAENGFPTNGYRNMIDLESFAKYVLIEQLMDNFDFNSKTQNGALPGSNYAYKDAGQKIKAGPLWDFDLSAVPCVAGNNFFGGTCSFGKAFDNPQEAIKPRHTFYQRLWSDPEFIGYLKAAWTAHKSDFDAIPAFVDSISNVLSGSVANNKCANPNDLMMGGTTNLTTQMYSSQVTKLKQWWTSRVSFFGTEVGKLSGTVTPPQSGFTLAVARNPSAGGNVSVKIGTGAEQSNPSGQLSAAANTSITITAAPNSGYTFENWTAVSGSLPSGITATSATITFSISGNVNIRANFKTQGTPPNQDNYTLQVSKSGSQSSNVTVTVGNGTPQAPPTNGSLSIPQGTSVTVTAAPASGRTFQNWTAAAGTALPSGITATSPSITFTMSANVNITANFLNSGTTTYALTVSGEAAQGSVSVNGQSYTFGQASNIASGETVTLTAAAKSGYMFLNWSAGETALPSGINQGNASNASVTFTMSGIVNIRANFRDNSGGAKTDTLVTIEAEDFTSSSPQAIACPANPPNNQAMCIGTNASNGVTNIGYISSGNTATYNVTMAADGSYKLVFKIASNGQASFRVSVNGTSMGTISGNTNDWDGYTYVALDQDVYLNAGSNTIRLEFQSSVNVDHFVVIGQSSSAIRYAVSGTASKARAGVTLKASPRGFSALLPANHGYTSYRLLDMRGREVKRGRIGVKESDLRFNNLNRGVLFLRLEGKAGTKPLVMRAVTY